MSENDGCGAIYVVCHGRLLANVRLNLRQVFATSLWRTCRLMFSSTLKTGSGGLTSKESVQLSRTSGRRARALRSWLVRREVVDLRTTWQATVRWTLRRPERRLPGRLQDGLRDVCQVDLKTTLRMTFRSSSRRPGRRLQSALIIALARRSHNKSAT